MVGVMPHSVGLVDRLLHLLDGLVEGNHVGDFEKGRLHDRIGARAEPQPQRDMELLAMEEEEDEE